MLRLIALSAFLMVATTAIHAWGMMLAMKEIEWQGRGWLRRLRGTKAYRVGGIIFLMFLATLVEVFIYALTYLALNAIEGFERALYFSMVSFTTLGYGDIVLNENWRLLASFEAANGIIMFGWTTAIVIAAVQDIYFGKKKEGED